MDFFCGKTLLMGAHYCAVMEAVLGASHFAFNGEKASFLAAIEAMGPGPEGFPSEMSGQMAFVYDMMAQWPAGDRLAKIMEVGFVESITKMKAAMALEARLAELQAGPHPKRDYKARCEKERLDFKARCEKEGLSLNASIDEWRQVCERTAMAEVDALLQKIATASVEEQDTAISKKASACACACTCACALA